MRMIPIALLLFLGWVRPVTAQSSYFRPVAPRVTCPAGPPQTVYSPIDFGYPGSDCRMRRTRSLLPAAIDLRPVLAGSCEVGGCPPYGGHTVTPIPTPVPPHRPLMSLRPYPQDVMLGRGILGQPKVYVSGQPLRNALRFLTP